MRNPMVTPATLKVGFIRLRPSVLNSSGKSFLIKPI